MDCASALLLLFRGDRMTQKKNKGKGGNVVQSVWKMAQPIIEGLGMTIWDVRFVKEGAYHYLRIFIDRPEGVTIDDCEAVSRAVNGPLDELDPISEEYCFEVCSPGIERELTRPEHFEAYLGAVLNIRMIRPLENGSRDITAILHSYEDNQMKVELQDGTMLTINRKDAASVRLNEEYVDIEEEEPELEMEESEKNEQ